VKQNVAQANPPETTQKLHKVLAQAGLGSRREMESWISEGKVTVNGVAAKLGLRVGEGDQIKVAGRTIRAAPASRLPRVLLYHKPEGEIVSRDDPRGRPSVFEKLPAVSGAKWIAIGRLDFNTCGLLVFTTSGELANRMMHPRFEIEREYAVRVMGQLQPQHLQQLTQGIDLDDGIARCERVELRGGEGANQWCHVVIKEGRNREVRRLFEKLGFIVSRLMRVRFGAIELPPRLKRGKHLELKADETQRLLEWLATAPPAPSSAPIRPSRQGRVDTT
jgi:23S rRNA pseudouridine2605 synthase